MYFVWPAAGIHNQSAETQGKRGLTRQDRFYESDPDDDDDDDDDMGWVQFLCDVGLSTVRVPWCIVGVDFGVYI